MLYENLRMPRINNMKHGTLKLAAIAGLLLAFMTALHATSVLQLSVMDLCERAALIFEGTVINVETRAEENSHRIWTLVTFEINERIKGPDVGNRITLHFLGGTVGEETLRVSAMNVPELGETGIYFVESLKRRQVNPLMGWSQGHLLLARQSDGVKRAMTRHRRPILGIDEDETPASGLSSGAARGLRLGARDADAMTAAEFKLVLRRMILRARRSATE